RLAFRVRGPRLRERAALHGPRVADRAQVRGQRAVEAEAVASARRHQIVRSAIVCARRDRLAWSRLGDAKVALRDVERAIATRDPQLGELLVRYLAQDDPEPGHDELGDADEDVVVDVPAAAFTYESLTKLVKQNAAMNATQRKLARREGFDTAERSPFAPPRLRLGAMLIDLYARGDEAG